MSTTWVIYPKVRDNSEKSGLIPDKTTVSADTEVKDSSPSDESTPHQVVGKVKAYQA